MAQLLPVRGISMTVEETVITMEMVRIVHLHFVHQLQEQKFA